MSRISRLTEQELRERRCVTCGNEMHVKRGLTGDLVGCTQCKWHAWVDLDEIDNKKFLPG